MTGIERIARERRRQIAVEGWTPEHDAGHTQGELAQAAACYAWPAPRPLLVKKAWPWDWCDWKPDSNERIRELEKAGALIAAELDRLTWQQQERDRREAEERLNSPDWFEATG